MRIKKGSSLRVSIEKFADKGKSIARVDGLVVFVKGAVPGDVAEVRVLRSRKKFAEAKIERLLQASELRTDPRCRYAGSCGGCKWQHVDYAAQLEAKAVSVSDAFRSVPGFHAINLRPIIGADEIFFYRNKMEFSFGANRWLTPQEIASGSEFDKDFALGLHAPGQFAKIIDIQECYLQSPESVQIVNLVRSVATAHRWQPWDPKRAHGLLRHLVIREGKRTGERMVNVVLSRYDSEVVGVLAENLSTSGIPITTLVATINDTPAQTAIGDDIRVISGPGFISEELGGFRFRIGPQSFFQTNSAQAERLYGLVRDYAALKADDCLYDVYCGTGTIGISLAADAKRVVGIEAVEDAVQDARVNAQNNGVDNCTFVAGDVLRELSEEFINVHGSPDVVILDPPRAGLHPRVVKRLVNLGAKRVVYVSCNPQTQARDIELLDGRYHVDELQPIDLFPHTDHVENVARLTLAT